MGQAGCTHAGRQASSGVSDQLLQCCNAVRTWDSTLMPTPRCGTGCAAGAVIAQRLRGAVAQQLSFTCSAGIGPNKLLAKIGSAKNKPNKQTVVLPRAIDSLMQVRGGYCVQQQQQQPGHSLCNCTAATLASERPMVVLGCQHRWCCVLQHDAPVVFSTLTALSACLLCW